MSVSDIADALRSAGLSVTLRGPADVVVHGATQDSRRVSEGDVFLAWAGTAVDAHDHVPAAVDAGAVALVVERALPDVDVPQLVVDNGRAAAAVTADVLGGSPWRNLFLAAVTGTNGKTTTAMMARHILSSRGPAAAIGTLGVTDDAGVRPGTEGLTTPGPVQLTAWLRELVEDGVEAVVMEASSHALDQRRLDGVRFAVAAFTNLSQDHLDYHGDLDDYRDAKLRLTGLAGPDATLVVNRDEDAWDGLDAGGRRVLGFSVGGEAEVRAADLRMGSNGSTFRLTVGDESEPVHLRLLGRFNVENALAAAGIAVVAGMNLAAIAEGLSSVPQIAGRLELVHGKEFAVLIDFAHTPDALRNVLTTLRPLTKGRLVVVFGAGGDRDRSKRGPMAMAVSEEADVLILTSDNPRTEDPERILDDLCSTLEAGTFRRIADRRAAIHAAVGDARGGDTVLLAGKGHETYQVVGTEKLPFDERVIVREAVQRRGAA